jgi:hypothetical protein
MQSAIDKINERIAPIRQAIINHKVYGAIKDIESLQVFMQFHVYAVWDFMSLLKALQNNLTCVKVPWFPVGDANTRYLINEIVTGEESDIDEYGERKSHFELYLEAMQQCNANVSGIGSFCEELQQGNGFEKAYLTANTPTEARSFVDFTFDIINSQKAHLQSAVFTFGREDLIPNMFHAIVGDIHKQFPDSVSIFKYYLERHIEVDGDHHSHLALQMTTNLCGNNPQLWQEAEDAIVSALEQRMNLWDGVYRMLHGN